MVTHVHTYWDQLQRDLCQPCPWAQHELGRGVSGWGIQAGLGFVEGWEKIEKGTRIEAGLLCPASLTVAVPPGHITGPLCASVSPSALLCHQREMPIPASHQPSS